MDDLAAPDGYTFTRRIGRGASSVVWEALHAASGDRVALKVLEADIADPDARRQFDRERRAMTALARHPNILTIVDAGVQDGRPWLALELCRRGSLASYVADGGPLDLTSALRLLDRLAGALAVAHDAGVVHCDIKPANVMLTDAGEPALGDFGIARVSVGRATTTTVGGFSLDHVAPELLDDGPRTPQSDLYSLGTTLWELLAGRPPFRSTADISVGAVLTRILRQPLPEAPGVPDDVLALLRRTATKTPEERPASMREVAVLVRELAAHHGVALDGAPLPGMTAVEVELGDQPLAPAYGAPTHLRAVSAPPAAPPVDAAATRLRAAATPPAAGRPGGGRRPVVAAVAVVLVAALGAAVVGYQMFGARTAAPSVALQARPPATAEVGPPPAEPTTAEPTAEAVAALPVAAVAAAPGRPHPAPTTRPLPTTHPTPPPSMPSSPPPSPHPPSSPPPTVCAPHVVAVPGDINGDGKVGDADKAILLSQWNQTGSDLSGDLNHDGVVNLTDMSILLSHWNQSGKTC